MIWKNFRDETSVLVGISRIGDTWLGLKSGKSEIDEVFL
jgi:hypothetical protein